MIDFMINLALYTAGFIGLAALNFHGVMELNLEDSSHVTALLIASPALLWAQAASYHYLYEGMELLITSIGCSLSEFPPISDVEGLALPEALSTSGS